jgi:hypothetical protein
MQNYWNDYKNVEHTRAVNGDRDRDQDISYLDQALRESNFAS